MAASFASASSLQSRAQAYWEGRVDTSAEQTHPLKLSTWDIELVAPNVACVVGFANVTIFRTSAGLVAVDCGSPMTASEIVDQVRSLFTADLMHTIIYTHGHVDHCFGSFAFDAEAQDAGRPLPVVIAHEKCVHRFERYKATAGYNGHINMRQFSSSAPLFPTRFRMPDRRLTLAPGQSEVLRLGELALDLYHDRGETDDGLWVWDAHSRVLCTGDLFIWCCPNCGNPSKVQRYASEWAAALRRMLAVTEAAGGVAVMVPGHGPPVFGAERVAQALREAAELLETLVEQTLTLMNAGHTLSEIVARVRVPAQLLARPYLRPVYDEPEFIVRNIFRLYGGWFDGEPAHLKPPEPALLGREIVALASGGDARRLALHAARLAAGSAPTGAHQSDEHLRLAATLVDFAFAAEPQDAIVCQAREAIYARFAAQAPSLMAKGIFGLAARQSKL